jgi:hypothetical protein
MTLTSKAQPNLVGGVSQQPDALRLDTQCRVQENAYGTIVEGLKKRFPTKWLNSLTVAANDNLAGASYHWVNRDPQERYLLAVVNNTSTGNQIRAWDLNGLPVFVHYPATLAVIQNYLAHSAMTDFKWTTVNDFTFLTNRVQLPTFGTQSAAQDKRKAYVYIRVPGYKTNYSISATAASGPALNVSVSTWDGTTAGPVQEEWTVNFTSTVVGTGSVTVLGYTRNFATTTNTTNTALNLSTAVNSTGAGDSMDDVVTGLYTAGQSSMRIRGDFGGLSFTPTVTAPGCTFTVTQTVNTGPATEYNSIKTDDIAVDLTTKINAAGSGWSATSSGSVIEIAHASQDILNVSTKDSVGDTAMKPYFLTVDNFDELPPRCRDGIVLRVQGSVETFEDDFYVKFVTKTAGLFDEGEWRETVGPEVDTALSNMPLTIVRRIDTAGTITGTPFQQYFSVEYYSWLNRLVGDDDSNPAPSFVGQSINDVFFHKNRLGFLTDSAVILSEAGVYGNFFRSSTRQLLDGDPIDLQAAYTSVAKLEHAVPHNERLLVFADRAQFVLSGEPLLTPKTGSLQFVSSYEVDVGQTPIAVGRNIYFATNRAGFGTLWEYQQILENVTVGSYSATDLASQVPRYIPQNIKDIAASPTDEVFFVRAPSDPKTLYVWKYFINGQQVLQSAWSKFTFEFSIYSIAMFENKLYMVAKLGDSWSLQRMDIEFGTASFNPVTAPLLDSQHIISVGNMVLNGSNTRITMPTDYQYPSPVTTAPVVVKPNGTVLTTTRINQSDYEVAGDQTGQTGLIFGFPYTMRYQFGRVDVREDTQRGGYSTIKSGRYQNLFGLIKFSKTNNFTISTQIQSETPKTMTYTAVVGNDEAGSVPLANGEYRFPTLTKTDNLTVEITNSTPFPSTFLGAEWIANFTTNFVRLRS